MTRYLLALIITLTTAPAWAADIPRYLIAISDGGETRPGLWFTVDGAELPPAIAVRPVRSLPEGVTIRAEAGRLRLSSDLASLFEIPPGKPVLMEIGGADMLGPSPDGLDEAVANAAGEAAAPVYAANDRIAALLEELSAEAARAEARAALAAQERVRPVADPYQSEEERLP